MSRFLTVPGQTVQGLAAGKNYRVRVRALPGGEFTGWASFTTLPSTEINDIPVVTLSGVRIIRGYPFAVTDQVMSIEGGNGTTDTYVWTADGVDVATTQTYRPRMADQTRADGRPKFMRAWIVRNGTRYPNEVPIRQIVYDTRWGVEIDGAKVDFDGRANFRLRDGAKYLFADAAIGDDSYNGLSPWVGYDIVVGTDSEISQGAANAAAGPKKTILAASLLIAEKAQAGDTVMLSNAAAFEDGLGPVNQSGTVYRDRGGFSHEYPTVFMSYDHLAPEDRAQWGRVETQISNSGRGVMISTNGSNVTAYQPYAFLGLRSANKGQAAQDWNTAMTSNEIYMWNVVHYGNFTHGSTGAADNTNFPAPLMTLTHSSFAHTHKIGSYNSATGLWSGLDHNSGMYGDGTRNSVGKSLRYMLFHGNGYYLDRDSQRFDSRAYTTSHNVYIQNNMAPVDVYGSLFSDGANNGLMARNGGKIVDSVGIRNAANFTLGGYGDESSKPRIRVEAANCVSISPRGVTGLDTIAISILITNTDASSFVKHCYTATGIASRGFEAAIPVAASQNNDPTVIHFEGNTHRGNGGAVRLQGAQTDGNLTTIITRTDDHNIVPGMQASNGSTGFVVGPVSGTNVNEVTVTFQNPVLTEEDWAADLGFPNYAELMDHAHRNPLYHWALDAQIFLLQGALPTAGQTALFYDTNRRIKGAVTPSGFPNDGSILDAAGHPTGVFDLAT